jgi:hypothetical protein
VNVVTNLLDLLTAEALLASVDEKIHRIYLLIGMNSKGEQGSGRDVISGEPMLFRDFVGGVEEN